MTHNTSRLAGLAIFGLLSLGDRPPYAIAAPVAVLGIVCLVLAVAAAATTRR